MANNALQWEGAFTDRGNVLTTELNSLANNARTNAGTALSNDANKDTDCYLELNVTFGSAPSSGGYIAIYMVRSVDGGSTFEDGSSSVDPGAHRWVCNIPVRAVTTAQKLISPQFSLPPQNVKFIAENKSGAAFPASGSTIKAWTGRMEVE